MSSFYWSSSTNSNNPDNAWNVNFNDGDVVAFRRRRESSSNVNDDNKNNDNYVRAVRGGS